MTTPILGLDTSNHNHPRGAPIDWKAVAASGRRFAVLKATEGGPGGFIDPYLATDRAGAHTAGLAVLLYHFARPADPAAQAAWFLSVIGPLAVGEGIAVDDEDPAITPAWVKTFCDTIAAQTGVKPLVYINQTYQNTQDWSGVVADNDGEWLARYDNSFAQPSGGPWGAPAMKQYTDAGTVPGITGLVDLDVFYGTEAQLAAYGLQGGDMALAPDERAWLQHIYDSMTPGIENVKYDGHGYNTLKNAAWQLLDEEKDAQGTLVHTEGEVLAAVRALRAQTAAPQQAPVDAAAVAAALAANSGFVDALVAAVVPALAADLAKRFATPPPATTA